MPATQHRTVSLIVAMSENRVIGRGGTLPWRLPADMRHFVRLTRGKPVIMGRRNFEDIGQALRNRHNIVLTRNPDFVAPGCTVVHDMSGALTAAGAVEEIMVIGGEAIYELFMDRADRVYLTVVHADVDGDTRFPELDPTQWRVVDRAEHPADDDNPYAMTFMEYRRGRRDR